MEVPVFVIGVVIGGVLGGVLGYFAWGRARATANEEADKLRRDNVELGQENAKLQGQLEQVDTTKKILDTAKTELGDAFQATASRVLRNSKKEFLDLADENLGKTLERAKGEFEKRHREFQALVKPLSENYGKLNPQIKSLTSQTAKLSGALTNNRQVGNWGEVQLRKVVEIAGMVAYCDFDEQPTTGRSGQRPDMVIKLPNDRKVVVDAKTSIANYQASDEATDGATADKALNKHAEAMKKQVDNLARKEYWNASGVLDFVVMFVPGDQFLAAALRANPDLMEYSMKRRVAIATPASLIALLWTISNEWTNVRMVDDVKAIQKAGKELYERICKYREHNENVGKGLSDAVKAYNRSVGSFEVRVVPKGKHFAELTSKDDFQSMPIVEDSVRTSKSAEALPPRGAGPSERSTPAPTKTLTPTDELQLDFPEP